MPGLPMRRLLRGKDYIKMRIFAIKPVWSEHWCGRAVPQRADQSVPQSAGHMLQTVLCSLTVSGNEEDINIELFHVLVLLKKMTLPNQKRQL